jgi:hypothetical protein
MQETELDRAKRLIRAMTAVATDRAASEAEVNFAVERVGRLLQQFNLSMADVELSTQPCVQKKFDTNSKRKSVLHYTFKATADLCGVRVWLETSFPEKKLRWVFFGLESDVDMAIYLCSIILSAHKRAVEEYKDSEAYKRSMYHGKTKIASFTSGFGRRMAERITKMIQTNSVESTGTSLVVAAKEKYLADEFAKIGLILTNGRGSKSNTRDRAGFFSGSAHANSVNLNRPVEHSRDSILKITHG